MKKTILTAVFTALTLGTSLTAHAGEMLERDYIEAEIWEEMWLGRGDNGTDFPEASYKHHLLEEWIDGNYGSDEYNWSDIGELKYAYKDYYEDYIEDWDFNDDDNGSWTIRTDEHTYSFTMFQNEWLMLDENGDTVDTFPPFSTLKEAESERVSAGANEGNADTPKVRGSLENRTETASDELVSEDGQINDESTESSSESHTDDSKSNMLPIIAGVIAVGGIGAAGIYLYQRKK